MLFIQVLGLLTPNAILVKQLVQHTIGNDYLNGSAIRRDYLETAINWISKGNIEVYMSNHQHDQNASALWRYYKDVISWVEATFPKKGINL